MAPINKWDSTSISMTSGFSVLGKKPNFSRDLFENLEQMVACPEKYLPDAFHAQIVDAFYDPADPYIDEDHPGTIMYPAGQMFQFCRTNELDPILGRWTPLSGGSGAIDDMSKTRLDASWSCNKLYGLIGDFDNTEMLAWHDRKNPAYNATSSPIEIEYDPDNPKYFHGVSDPHSPNYNPANPNYDPISDPESDYYDPTSPLYNGVVDFNNEALYDPDNSNYQPSKDSSNLPGKTRADGNPSVPPYYVPGSNDKFIPMFDKVDDINEAVNILDAEEVANVQIVPYTNSEGKGSTPLYNLVFENRYGKRVAICYGTTLNADIIDDYEERNEDDEEVHNFIQGQAAASLPHIGLTHNLEMHYNVENDYGLNYEEFKKWVPKPEGGSFTPLNPYVETKATHITELLDEYTEELKAAGFDIDDLLIGFRPLGSDNIVPSEYEEPVFIDTGDEGDLVLGHYNQHANPMYNSASDPTSSSYQHDSDYSGISDPESPYYDPTDSSYSGISDPTSADYDTTSDDYNGKNDKTNVEGGARPDGTEAEEPWYSPDGPDYDRTKDSSDSHYVRHSNDAFIDDYQIKSTYSAVSDPTSPDYDPTDPTYDQTKDSSHPDNPDYFGGVSDSKSPNYAPSDDPLSNYDGVSDPCNVEGAILPDAAGTPAFEPYYDPTSEDYNPVVDYTSADYDPNYVPGSNDKYALNPEYNIYSDPDSPDYDPTSPDYDPTKDKTREEYIEHSNSIYILDLVAQYARFVYSKDLYPEGRWVNTYKRPDRMVLRWSDKTEKWEIRPDSLDEAKEYTDKQIRLAINGQAYVSYTEPVFHSAELDPVTGEIVVEGFVEYTDGDGVLQVGVPEARYYWSTTDPDTGEDKTWVYLWMDETGRQQEDEGNWLILDAADVNFTQFWSKQIDTVDDYWWRDESKIRHTWQDETDDNKKEHILSLYGTEKAIQDWTVDSISEDKAKDVKDHPLSANQGYLIDQNKEERMQFNNVDGYYDLRVPEACEALEGKVIWYYGPTKYASVSWDHVPNGSYTNIHDFEEYFWNLLYHTYPNLKNIEIDKCFEADMYTIVDKDGIPTRVDHIFKNPGDVIWKVLTSGDFDNTINMGISTESVWEVLEFHNTIQISYDDPNFDPEYPPEGWKPEDGWPRLIDNVNIALYRTLLEDMETANFYRCVRGTDEEGEEIFYWSKVDMGGDAYQTRYVSSYCQEAQPTEDFIDGTRNIDNVGTALDKIYYELWGVETKITRFRLTYGYLDPDGVVREATHDYQNGNMALELGQSILPTYTIGGVEKQSKLTWQFSKPLASEAPSSTDVIEQQFLFIDGGMKIVGNNKHYELPIDAEWKIGTTFKLRGVDAGGQTVEATFTINEGGIMYYGDLPHHFVYDYNLKDITWDDVWEYIKTQTKEAKVSKAGIYTPNAELGHSFFAYPAAWGDICSVATYPLLKESGKQSVFWDLSTLDYYDPQPPTKIKATNDYGQEVDYYVAYSTQTRHGTHFTWVIDVELVTDDITGEIYENEFVKQNQGPSNAGKILAVDEFGEVILQDIGNIECNIEKLSTMPAADGSWEGQLVEYVGGTTDDYTHNGLYVCNAKEFEPGYEWVLVSGAGGITQVDEMPPITVHEENNIYQYIGPFTSTPEGGTFKHNSIYVCDKDKDTDELYWKEIGSGALEQYETLPSPIGTLKNKVVQYVGVTKNDPVTGKRWVHSNLYVCDAIDPDADPVVYEWRDVTNNKHLNALDVPGILLKDGVTGYVKTVGNIVFFSLTHEGDTATKDIAQFMPRPFGDVFFVPKFKNYEVGDDFRVEILDGSDVLRFSDNVSVKNFTVSGSYISEDLEPVGVIEGTNPEYVKRDQGEENRGKFLVVNESGMVVPEKSYSMRPKNIVSWSHDTYTSGSVYRVGPIIYVELKRRGEFAGVRSNTLATGLPKPFQTINVPIKADNGVITGTLDTDGNLTVDVVNWGGEEGVYNMDCNFSYPDQLEFDMPVASSANYILRQDLTTEVRDIVLEVLGEDVVKDIVVDLLVKAGIITDLT